MAEDVEFEVERHPTHTVIRVSGFLDLSTSPRLRDRILEAAEARPPAMIIDLGPVEFLDSSALGVILNGWKLMHAEGSTLVVVSPQQRITKLFEMTALNLSIKLYRSVADAVGELPG